MKRVPLVVLAAAGIAATSATAFAADMMMSNKPVTVTMKAQNGSRESGTATLMQSGGNIVVKISLKNGTAMAQPAHIHMGSCSKLNPAPKYPLTNVVHGMSTTTLNGMKLSGVTMGTMAINVHKSAADLKTYVSCGDIPKMSMSHM